jgi:hypothetical protein
MNGILKKLLAVAGWLAFAAAALTCILKAPRP